MRYLITICARGGSKGIPGKNVKELNGKPLLAYTIATAQAFAEKMGDTHIGLSTDDPEIKATAERYNLHTAYQRPDMLASDQAGKIGVIDDLRAYEEERLGVKFEYVIDLDVTSPLRTVTDLQDALDLLQANEQAYNVFSVSPAQRSPYFNMVERKENGFYRVVKETDGEILYRQKAPQVYDMNASFYIFRSAYFEQGFTSSITPRSLAYVVPHLCFDLDHPHDFMIMELLLKHQLLDFFP